MDGISNDSNIVSTSHIKQNTYGANRFTIVDWAAWAPGLAESSAWLPWPELMPSGTNELPALTEMPAMMRRRLDKLGRMALQAAYRCHDANIPVIFASRYGDLARSAGLLRSLAESGAVSPTQFSLSVHNAIAALYGIANSDTSNYSAIAAGEETTEAAFIEALGLLADGTEEVMIVCYEDSTSELPGFLANNCRPHAWACRIKATCAAGISLHCRLADEDDSTAEQALDFAAVLRFLITDAQQLEQRIGHRIWQWQRHA